MSSNPNNVEADHYKLADVSLNCFDALVKATPNAMKQLIAHGIICSDGELTDLVKQHMSQCGAASKDTKYPVLTLYQMPFLEIHEAIENGITVHLVYASKPVALYLRPDPDINVPSMD